jgi:acyl transferase domain-containing protein
MVIKTACSSSLVALHEACRALHNGDATSAVVAGTNLLTGPDNFVLISSEGILSPDGSSKSFDASANGYARGEGITAVYVKKLEDAIRDGNPVRAVIRATGTNHDGKSQGLFSPRAETQELLMRKVYADAGLDPAETAFVEVRYDPRSCPSGDPCLC